MTSKTFCQNIKIILTIVYKCKGKGGDIAYLVHQNTRNIENKVVYLFVKKKKSRFISRELAFLSSYNSYYEVSCFSVPQQVVPFLSKSASAYNLLSLACIFNVLKYLQELRVCEVFAGVLSSGTFLSFNHTCFPPLGQYICLH